MFDTSVVGRSLCGFQWDLRMFEIQLDLRGEPAVTRQSTIELTEQVKPRIVTVERVFNRLNGHFVCICSKQVLLRLDGGQPLSPLRIHIVLVKPDSSYNTIYSVHVHVWKCVGTHFLVNELRSSMTHVKPRSG